MNGIALSELEAAIATPSHRPKSGARLVIAPKPDPFAAPTLDLDTSNCTDPLAVEVVFVQASAAVGKSIMAAHLSSSQQIALLDLAQVPVSTHSLIGLIQSDFSGVGNPVDSFHAGTLPLIIDALDEGRLLSGEHGFEGFIETTGELLLSDRNVIDRPKIVFFGRHESTDLAKFALEISGAGITTCSVEVGFFGKDAARNLIHAYARSSAKPGAAYEHHPGPVNELLTAYFDAIEAALELHHGTLWTDERGKAFAGYAPVLAALGSLLAEMDDFNVITNRLESRQKQEAWGVIETVLDAILERERDKLCDKLAQRIAAPVPIEAYDAQEQLTFLTRFMHRETLSSSGRVHIPSADHATYMSMVEQYLPEHPFIRHGKIENAVLGSLVLSHAVSHDLLGSVELHELESLSRQPFLWRSMRQDVTTRDSLIDGRYVGCILNSFWNDPVTKDPRVAIRVISDDGSANVSVTRHTEADLVFNITLPLILYGYMQDCDVDVLDTVTLKGQAPRDGTSTFYMNGTVIIICDAIEVTADSIRMDGKVWLEAEQVVSPSSLNIYLKKGTEVGWGGVVGKQFPWNNFPSTLTAPYPSDDDDVLTSLLKECRARLPDGPLILRADFTPTQNEARTGMRWANRKFPVAFPRIMELLIEHNLASTEPVGASGSDPKIRVRLDITWEELCNAVLNPAIAPKLQDFLTEAGRVINE